MRKAQALTIKRGAAHGHENFVWLWSMAMWVLALVYLLATFSIR